MSGTLEESGGFVPQSFFGPVLRSLTEEVERQFQMQVAAGWVYHRHPMTAREVIAERLELARSDDPNGVEGFLERERFGEPCPECW